MTVWVVESGEYEEAHVDAVCDTRAAAIRLVKAQYPDVSEWTEEQSKYFKNTTLMSARQLTRNLKFYIGERTLNKWG